MISRTILLTTLIIFTFGAMVKCHDTRATLIENMNRDEHFMGDHLKKDNAFEREHKKENIEFRGKFHYNSICF